MEIYNRTYIGSKRKLLMNIEKAVIDYIGEEKYIFADLFGGTGVVAEHFAKKGYKVIVNDILYSNYIFYRTWIGNEKVDEEKIEKYIKKFNEVDPGEIESNYFSEIYGEKYFSIPDAKKIGYIRDEIESLKTKLNEREYYMLLSSLLYATDKIANTVGHFEHYLSKSPEVKGVLLRKPSNINNKYSSKVYRLNANELVKRIKCDIAYIDPPYNSRQYINFYHVLENLANWDKPTEFEGKSMKFKRNHLKSDYSKSKAAESFKDLINNIDAKYIVMSYNNTYNANSGASNNKISEEEIYEILSSKGELFIEEIPYKFFNSGKTKFDNHIEKIYICKIK